MTITAAIFGVLFLIAVWISFLVGLNIGHAAERSARLCPVQWHTAVPKPAPREATRRASRRSIVPAVARC